MKKVFILTLITVIIIPVLAQKTDLSLKLEKDSSYLLSSNFHSTIIQEVNGQMMKTELSVKSTTNFFVKDIQDNEYIMEVSYDDLDIESTVRGQMMKYSSSKGSDSDLMSGLLYKICGESFSCYMNKNGSISKISGMEEIWDNILDSIPGIPESNKMQIRQQLEKTYGEEAFISSIGMSTFIYPDFSVSKGERWWINTKIGGGMIPAEMECDYLLADVTDEECKILGNSYFNTDKEKSSMMNGMEAFYDLRGEFNTDITVDKNSGWIISSNSRYIMEGDIIVNTSPQNQDGMTVPFRMNSTGIITSVPLN